MRPVSRGLLRTAARDSRRKTLLAKPKLRSARRGFFSVLKHLFHPHQGNNHRAKLLHPRPLWFLTVILVATLSCARLFSTSVSLQHLQVFHPLILGYSSSISPELVLAQTNQERTKLGLPQLTVNRQLSQAATAKAQHMFQNQYWAHVAPDGTQPWDFMQGYAYRVAGENLARDFQTTDTMVAAWMASPTHKANIINGSYQETGIAVVNGTLQGFETTLVVQMFGAPKTVAAQIPQQAAVSEQTEIAKAPTPAVQGYTESEQVAQQLAPADMQVLQQLEPVEPTAALDRIAQTSLLRSLTPPQYSPLDITKAIVLAIVLLLILTLSYDALIAAHLRLDRAVGLNFGHIMVFSSIAYLVLVFRSGLVL